MAFDYFSKRRMEYILTKIKGLFGRNNGIASLDTNGKLNFAQVPTNVIKTSSTSGLVRNDGSIDESDYALKSDIPDISGKANKSEMSVAISGDQTTIQLKNGTSATVINQHQDISGKVDKDGDKVLSDNNYTDADKDKVNALGTASTKDVGVANGIAELDSTGKVPSSQLPSFVDDVIEVDDYSHLPINGESGKIYVTKDTNKTYRWSGNGYIEISESLALGETSSTAYRGDRGKTAYNHATETKLTTATASGLYKVASTTQGHIASLTAVEKSDITALGIPESDTKNTAGSTDTSSKIFLVGATSQADNPQTYSDNEVYATSGTLSSKKVDTKAIIALTGTGTAGSDKGSGVSPRYIPSLWTFNSSITVANGEIYFIKIPVAGGTYGVWLSLNNGTNYYPVAVSNAKGRFTTQYAANTVIAVTYESAGICTCFARTGGDSTSDVTGIFRVLNDYDANTTYSAMSTTELTTGTATTSRVMRADYLKNGINSLIDTKIANKADKVASATNGNLAGLNESGNLTDSGVAASEIPALWKSQGEYGVKNLNSYPYYETNHTDHDVVWTDNGDGTVTANGTAKDGASSFICHSRISGRTNELLVPNGRYILTGCPSGGANNKYRMSCAVTKNGSSSSLGNDYGDGVEITVDSDDYYNDKAVLQIGCDVLSGFTASNLIFKPMLRLASDTDDTYQPYAKTNKELMDNLNKNWISQGILGAKNLIPYPWRETTKTLNGVIFTCNNGDSITISTVSEGATANTALFLRSYTQGLDEILIKKGETYIIGGISGGSTTTYQLYIATFLETVQKEIWFTTDGDLSFTPTQDFDGLNIYVRVASGTVITNPIIIKPMIRLAADTDDTYRPYALTNKQLTDNKADKVTSATNGNLAGLNASGNLTDSGVSASSIGNLSGSHLGTCETAAATSAKIVTIGDGTWIPKEGDIIGVKFTYSNTVSFVTLNVNGIGNKSIWYGDSVYIIGADYVCGKANSYIFYMYDGTYWIWLSEGKHDGNNYPSVAVYTNSDQQVKAGTCNYYVLTNKSYCHFIFRNPNTYKGELFMNINNTGSKTIYINGEISSSTNYTLPAGTYIAYYENDKWYFRTDGKLTANITGTAASDSTKADKVTSSTDGNLAGLNGSGNLTDSGWASDKTTTSASGNPISITGLKSNQLAVNPVITFEPIQAGSGDPSPTNIRAISGHDRVEVLSCGVNVWDEEWELGGIIWNTGEEYTATDRIRTGFIPMIDGGTYYVYRASALNISSIGVVFYDKNKKHVAAITPPIDTTIETPSGTAYARFAFIGITSYTSGISINYPSTVHDYVPYHKTTDISEPLPQTVYGGSLDVRTGKLKVTHIYRKYNGTENWTWYSASNSVLLNDALANRKGIGSTNKIYGISNMQATSSNGSINYIVATGTSAANLQIVQIGTNFGVTDVSLAGWKTWLATNNLEFTYELKTPIEIQLTPHEIPLLKDYAYVSTNGTNIAFDYHNGEIATLGDVAQLGETVNELGNIVGKLIKIDTVDIAVGNNKITTSYKSADYVLISAIQINSNTSVAGTVRAYIDNGYWVIQTESVQVNTAKIRLLFTANL